MSSINDETALIVWDEASKIQHFIRRATFTSSDKDFAFLVPTPTQPELQEAHDGVFGHLAKITEPRIVHRKVVNFAFGCASGVKTVSEGASTVAVLEQKRVGGLDAAVLAVSGGKDDDAKAGTTALAGWLKDRGYAFTPALAEWVKPYVVSKWVITAFKIAAPTAADAPRGNALQSTTVRMSFATDKPIYPYREPSGQTKGSSRALHIFLAARQRMAGRLDDLAQGWPGRTMWADKIAAPEMATVTDLARLPAVLREGEWWLTEFLDTSNPRPGIADISFSAASDPSPIARPPTEIQHDYGDVVAGAICIGIPLFVVVAIWLFARRGGGSR